MNVPEDAEVAFEGVRYRIYQWEQQIFDGSTTTFEAVGRNDSTQIFVTKDSNLLLLKEEQPWKGVFYGFPGGVVEDDEAVAESAERELLEETGILGEVSLLCKHGYRHARRDSYYFKARIVEETGQQSLDAGEKIERRWMTYREIKGHVLQDVFRNTYFARQFLIYDATQKENTIQGFIDWFATQTEVN